jgi:hybrid cluster-associated redox disulfide protein
MDKKITKELSIHEILHAFPEKSHEIANAFFELGVHCIGCAAASFESLEEGLLAHGKSEEEIDSFVKKLNQLIK